MRALVTGATGFVGPHLLRRLDRPVVLSRDDPRTKEIVRQLNLQSFSWNALAGPPPLEAFDGIDTVFHLAGDPIASSRWNVEKKRRIRESRELGTRHLVQAIGQLRQRPRVLVSASAVGWYGSHGDEILDETSSPGNGFLAEVCQAWEREAQAAADLGVRVVSVRIGIVMGPGGGALQDLLPMFRLGLGGPLGSGRQWMPWVHIDDLVAIFLHAAQHDNLSGPVNGTAPNPVTNKQFTKALARALHRPAFLPVPYFALRVGLGEFAKVLFDSQRAVPKAICASGFQFQYPEIDSALREIIAGQKSG